jgi:hypothetical protein
MRQSEYTNGRACDENIAAPEGRLFAGVHGMPAGPNSSCSAPIASALASFRKSLHPEPNLLHNFSVRLIPPFRSQEQYPGLMPVSPTKVSPSRSTEAMIYFLRGVVGIWFVFSLAATAAPTAVRQSFMVTAQVLAVDCSTRSVRTRACAPVVITIEPPRTENVKRVVTTVLYY